MTPPLATPPPAPMTNENSPVPSRRRGLTAIDAVLSLIAIILVVQMGLLTSTLDLYLAGHQDAAMTGAIGSGLLLFLNVALYMFIRKIDSRERKAE